MQNTMKCPDCQAEMEAGFIPDATYGMIMQTAWHRGDPQAKKTMLEKLRSGGGVKYDPKEMILITTYRCTGCGLLKLYAAPEEA